MKGLNSLVSKLCEPTSETYPDPLVKQAQWKRNSANCYGLSASVFLFTFFSPFPPTSALFWFSILSNLGTLIIFLCLCRSYIKLFNILHTIFLCVSVFLLFDQMEDFLFIYVGYAFAMPPFFMLFHGNIKLSTITCVIQLFIMKFQLKDAFIRALNRYTAEEFATRFISATMIIFFVICLVQLVLMNIANQSDIELQRAKRVAEEVLESQKTFIFSFSHELRNPINSLLGNLQLVLMGDAFPQATREMINTAKICGEILLQTINNVLDTGKFEMGNLEVNPAPTRISELLQKSWTIYQEILRQKKLKSLLKIERSMYPLIRVDSVKINQIISNLIGNAIKFTERGAINLTVEWMQKEIVNDECFEPEPYDETDEGIEDKDENIALTNRKYRDPYSNYIKLGEDKNTRSPDELLYPGEDVLGVLKITVQDTGCGMKKENLEKLFKKFSQVSEDVSRRQMGTGLGLFITKEICKAMNGDIRVYSQFGVGTTFIACIPTVAIALPGSPRANSESMIDLLQGKKIRTIVADDSPFNVKLTSNYLSQIGASVVSVAYNGEDAYVKYKESQINGNQIDLIILDIDMPKLNGKQVCDKIRKYEKENRLKPIKIIFISGNYDKEQMNEYLDPSQGPKANLFLKKPISFEDFTNAMYRLWFKE